MSKRDVSLYVVDILIAINKIQRYSAKFSNAEEFKWSELEWDATLRELEIIGEATNKLIKFDILNNERYRKIVDFRNLIIHGYFGIDEDEVWIVITTKLDSFLEDLLQTSNRMQIDIKQAIEFAKEENYKNSLLVDFLNKVLE